MTKKKPNGLRMNCNFALCTKTLPYNHFFGARVAVAASVPSFIQSYTFPGHLDRFSNKCIGTFHALNISSNLTAVKAIR